MRGVKKVLLTLALVLGTTGLCMGNAAAVSTSDDFNCAYSVSGKTSDYVYYGSTDVKTYTAEEAAAAGVPAGYEGEVIEVMGSTSRGFLLDFSAQQIPMGLVEALEFRVYLGLHASNEGTNYPQIRIPNPYALGSEWVFQEGKATPTGEWTTVRVPATKAKFPSLGENGYLNKFELSVRSQGSIVFYVDSIDYVLKANDNVAPVINCTEGETFTAALGEALDFTVTATDAQQGDVPVEYIWDNGVELNANGTPVNAGTYNLTLKAVDFYGNTSTKTVKVKVVEADRTAPTIALDITEVKTMAGVKPMLKVTATDDSGNCTVTKTWSEGALDKKGCLTAGTHTWTIVATDMFGNQSTKTVTFIVTANEPAYSFVTDESDIFGEHTVTFDGQNPVSVGYGFKLVKPADPVREADAAAKYTFLGWYYGDKEWDFDTDVVTEDMDLQSKWEETKRIYRVTFEGVNDVKKVEYGNVIPESAIPADPTKAANVRYEFTFDGWYVGNKKWDFATDVVTGDVTLKAKFIESPRLYEVTFDGENAISVGYGEKIEKPADPTKEATETHRYEFLGWFYGENEWNFETGTVKNAMNLQAKWREIELEVEGPAVDDTTSDAVVEQPGVVEKILAGCSGVVGLTGTMAALSVAAVVLFKRKED